MGIYQERILPRLIDWGMRNRDLAAYRQRTVAAAAGRVLEVGIGSGLNLPFYGGAATRVFGLDPSPKLLAMAREATRKPTIPLELIEGAAEAIPLQDGSVDTVVITWTLCSIPDVSRALEEMRRVLTPGGSLLFVEHGRAPEPRVRWWQDALTPVWKHVAGGCHLNRAIGKLVMNAGFRIEQLENSYVRGPKPMTYMYEGRARSS